jgi:hypothetical protein
MPTSEKPLTAFANIPAITMNGCVKKLNEKLGALTMDETVIIDYARPCMDAEKALRDAHEAVLEQNLDLAMTKAMDAVICARLMYGALRHMKEKNEKAV